MVRRVFNFMYREVRGLHQAAYILALFAIGSQLLAVVRDRLLANQFGAGSELDLYYAAFRIPDLMFVLFASVLSVYVLLPFVSRYTEEGGALSGGAVLSQVFTLFLCVYSCIAVILAVTTQWYIPWLFPGFTEEAESLAVLLQILLFQAFLLGISSLCGVVTQMSHRFVLYAVSPLLYNIGIIIGIAIFYPIWGLSGLVSGVVLGALGHLLIQIPFVLKSEYCFKATFHFDWKLLKDILFVAVPRALTLSVNQIVLLVLTGMASLMAVGSVSVFQFAFNLQSVPLAVIGMSYSVAAFPTLSTLLAKNMQREFNHQLLTALRHIIFWAVPISALIIVLRAQIVRVLLGSGSFDWSDTRLTAAAMALFVMALIAQSVLLLLVRAFYAGGKTVLPLIVAICSSVFSLGLAWYFHLEYVASGTFRSVLEHTLRLEGVPGTEVLVLVLAFVIGQFVQLIILMLLSVRSFTISYRPLLRLSLEAIFAATLGSLAAYTTLVFVVDGVNQETFIGISLQGIVAGVIGLASVVFAYWIVKAPELLEIYRSFHARIFKTDIVAPQPDTL